MHRTITAVIIAAVVVFAVSAQSGEVAELPPEEPAPIQETPISTPAPMPTPPPTQSPAVTPSPTPKVIHGTLTYYDDCAKCNGRSDGVLRCGLYARNGTPLTAFGIAACNWLPLGSVIEIEGEQYLVADTGGRQLDEVGRVDIFVPEGHYAALKMGVRQAEIIVRYVP